MLTDVVKEIVLWFISGMASVLSGGLIFMYAAEGMLISEGGIKGSFRAERVRIRSNFLLMSIMLAFVAIIGLPWSGYFPFVSVAIILVTIVFLYRIVWKTGIYHDAVRRQFEKHKNRDKR